MQDVSEAAAAKRVVGKPRVHADREWLAANVHAGMKRASRGSIEDRSLAGQARPDFVRRFGPRRRRDHRSSSVKPAREPVAIAHAVARRCNRASSGRTAFHGGFATRCRPTLVQAADHAPEERESPYAATTSAAASAVRTMSRSSARLSRTRNGKCGRTSASRTQARPRSLVTRRVEQRVLDLPIHLRHEQAHFAHRRPGRDARVRVGATIGMAIDGRPCVPSAPSRIEQDGGGNRVSHSARCASRPWQPPAASAIEEVARQKEDVGIADVVGEGEDRRDRVRQPHEHGPPPARGSTVERRPVPRARGPRRRTAVARPTPTSRAGPRRERQECPAPSARASRLW